VTRAHPRLPFPRLQGHGQRKTLEYFKDIKRDHDRHQDFREKDRNKHLSEISGQEHNRYRIMYDHVRQTHHQYQEKTRRAGTNLIMIGADKSRQIRAGDKRKNMNPKNP